MSEAHDQGRRWVVRLRPAPGTGVERLLRMPLGLDVWERRRDLLVAAASEGQIGEIERRRLATVERLCTVEEYVSGFRPRVGRGDAEESEEESQG